MYADVIYSCSLSAATNGRLALNENIRTAKATESAVETGQQEKPIVQKKVAERSHLTHVQRLLVSVVSYETAMRSSDWE